jgi:hypothetical protein
MKTASLAQMVVRIAGLVQLVLGVITWTGSAGYLTPIHIIVGSLLVVALLVLSYLAARSGFSTGIVVLAVAWALVLPAWGMAQEKLLPGTSHWIIQVLHLLCGIGAIGLAEMLGMGQQKKSPTPVH